MVTSPSYISDSPVNATLPANADSESTVYAFLCVQPVAQSPSLYSNLSVSAEVFFVDSFHNGQSGHDDNVNGVGDQ